MFVRVHKPQKGQNSGSCSSLAEYLDKEKETSFFSSSGDNFERDKVVDRIDRNAKGGLKKHEDKFYMLSINPSQKELNHLIGRKVDDVSELSASEKIKIEDALKSYTHDVMDIYARNFGRDDINDRTDLVYFARIETTREYREYDKDVINGEKKTGQQKEGLNYHVHVLVSRKAADKKTLLSPCVKSRGNNWELNGHEAKRGFNHEAFKVASIEKFNEKFNYKSQYNEGYKSKSNNLKLDTNKLKLPTHSGLNLTKEQLQNEKKIARNVNKAVKYISNPALSLKSDILNKIKKIALGQEKGMSI